MSEPATYDLTLKRVVNGAYMKGADRIVTVRRGWTGSELTAEAQSLFKLSLMSLELRAGDPKGAVIGSKAKIWTSINGDTATAIYCCT